MSKSERAARERARRRAKAKAALDKRIEEIRVLEHKAGFDKGVRAGMSMTRAQVLEHAGALYKLGKDANALAVREVYKALESPLANTEERRG